MPSLEIPRRTSSAIRLHYAILNQPESIVLQILEQMANDSGLLSPGIPKALYCEVPSSRRRLLTKIIQYRGFNHKFELAVVSKPSIYELNKELQTALHLACKRGLAKVVVKLFEMGYNRRHVSLPDGAGKTALHYAVQIADSSTAITILKILIDNGADLNARDLNYSTARHSAIRRKEPFSKNILKLLTDTQSVETMRQQNSHSAFHRMIYRFKMELELSENFYGSEIHQEFQLTGMEPYTDKKQLSDKHSLERIVCLLRQIRVCANTHKIQENQNDIKLAFELIGSMSRSLSKETKGGYQQLVPWTQIEYLSALLQEGAGELDDYLMPLLMSNLPGWSSNDFAYLERQFIYIIEDYDNWVKKNQKACSASVPFCQPELEAFHAFISYFQDLNSLRKIIYLSNMAASLEIDNAMDKRALLQLVKKIGDSSKYSHLGTNLTFTSKNALSNIPWADLLSLRNKLKEMAKFPDRRKLVRVLIQDEQFNSTLAKLQQAIISLGAQANGLKTRMLNFKNGVPAQHMQAIQTFYASEGAAITLGQVVDYSVIAKQRIFELLADAVCEAMRNSPGANQVNAQIAATQKEVVAITANEKIPAVKKQKLLEDKDDKLQRLATEYNDLAEPVTRIIERVESDKGLNSRDRDDFKRLCGPAFFDTLIKLYVSSGKYRVISMLDEALTIGDKQNANLPEVQMLNIKLARIELENLRNMLIPDLDIYNRLLEKRKLDNDYCLKVNPETKYLHERFEAYASEKAFFIKVNSILVDIVFYITQSGIVWSAQLRNGLEHSDPIFEVLNFSMNYQRLLEQLSYLFELPEQLDKREQELHEVHRIPKILNDPDLHGVLNAPPLIKSCMLELSSDEVGGPTAFYQALCYRKSHPAVPNQPDVPAI